MPHEVEVGQSMIVLSPFADVEDGRNVPTKTDNVAGMFGPTFPVALSVPDTVFSPSNLSEVLLASCRLLQSVSQFRG